MDFSNAFNMVDRTEMLAQVYEKLPGLYRWVLYCYSHPAHLFFGSIILQSMAGVQQGDPLGPLFFPLVLRPLASKIQSEFPHLDLCVFSLDDGVIIGHRGFAPSVSTDPTKRACARASPECEEERNLVAV